MCIVAMTWIRNGLWFVPSAGIPTVGLWMIWFANIEICKALSMLERVQNFDWARVRLYHRWRFALLSAAGEFVFMWIIIGWMFYSTLEANIFIGSLAGVVGVFCGVCGYKIWAVPHRAYRGRCVYCAYSLMDLDSDICPECGNENGWAVDEIDEIRKLNKLQPISTLLRRTRCCFSAAFRR